MLKITNYHKLFRKDIGNWRVGRIEEIDSAYLIHLMTSKGRKWQINLERTPVGNQKQYELWCWSDILRTGVVAQTAVPIRIMMRLDELRDVDRLLDSIKSLTNNI